MHQRRNFSKCGFHLFLIIFTIISLIWSLLPHSVLAVAYHYIPNHNVEIKQTEINTEEAIVSLPDAAPAAAKSQ
jgi:hypothetical protein